MSEFENNELREPQPIRRVSRLVLPPLKLLTDPTRLSIVERLYSLNHFGMAKQIMTTEQIPASSFFKFAAELTRSGLIDSADEYSHRDRYNITPFGKEALELMFDLGDGARLALTDSLVSNMSNLGLSTEELEEIKQILLRSKLLEGK